MSVFIVADGQEDPLNLPIYSLDTLETVKNRLATYTEGLMWKPDAFNLMGTFDLSRPIKFAVKDTRPTFDELSFQGFVGQTEKFDAELKNLSPVEPPAATRFSETHNSLDIKIKVKSPDVYDVFNDASATAFIPVLTCRSYYKILDTHRPPDLLETIIEESAEQGEHTITLHVQGDKETITRAQFDPASRVVSMRLDIRAGVTLAYIETQLRAVFKNIETLEVKQTGVSGTFVVFQGVTPYIWQDAVLVNPVFRKTLSLSESTRANLEGKKRQSMRMQMELDRGEYKGGKKEEKLKVTFNLRSGQAKVNDPITREFPMISKGQTYTKVTVLGIDTIENAKAFHKRLLLFVGAYNKIREQIYSYYKAYLPKKAKQYKDVTKSTGEDTDKSLFVSNYSRSQCPKDRLPTVVPQGNKGTLFPRKVEEGKEHYPSDDPDRLRKFYECKSSKYPHLGLTVNKLTNKNDFPVVPCCFQQPQEEKDIYKSYFAGKLVDLSDNKKKRGKGSSTTLKTDKYLGVNKFGELPKDIQRLLLSSDLKSTTPADYLRVGVSNSPHTFIQCAAKAIDGKKLSDAGALRVREEMSGAKTAVVGRQSMFDKTVEDIQQLLTDETVALAPSLFSQIVGDYFKCNIILFSKEKGMVPPKNMQGYYYPRNEYPCVYVYLPSGSETQQRGVGESTHCELIVKKDPDSKQVQYTFPSQNNPVVDLYRSLSSYADLRVTPATASCLDALPVLHQGIDAFGKTREITLNLGGGTHLTILTPPLPQFPVDEKGSGDTHYLTDDTATQMLEALPQCVQVYSQLDTSGTITEVRVRIGDLVGRIPSKLSSLLPDIPVVQGFSTIPRGSSRMQTFRRNKRVSFMIRAYARWLKAETKDSVDTFLKDRIIVVRNYNYGKITNRLDRKSSFLSADAKLIVPDGETVNRLSYVLQKDEETGVNYKGYTHAPGYYTDLEAFTVRPGQVLLRGAQMLKTWLQTPAYNDGLYTLYHDIPRRLSSPYFFISPFLEDGEVLLAQNTLDDDRSLQIMKAWCFDKYNPGEYPPVRDVKDKREPVYSLYMYENSKKIYCISNDGCGDKLPILLHFPNARVSTVLMDMKTTDVPCNIVGSVPPHSSEAEPSTGVEP